MGFLPNKSPAYQYIPDSLAIPPLGATENQPDPVAFVKLFTPDSSWTWYIVEYDPETERCYGLVEGHFPELGYFSLQEIREVRGAHRLPVERDLHFEPTPLSKLQQ